jgi:hypothetical protein
MIVGGSFIMTALLLVIGGISTIGSAPALSATVAFMVIWGFLYQVSLTDVPNSRHLSKLNLSSQATLGAVAYSIGGETARYDSIHPVVDVQGQMLTGPIVYNSDKRPTVLTLWCLLRYLA